MTRYLTAIAAAATLVAAPAFANDPAPSKDKPAAEKKICIAPHHTTGTMLAKKTCLTRAKWIEKTGVDPLASK
jgi:hypothetical protein